MRGLPKGQGLGGGSMHIDELDSLILVLGLLLVGVGIWGHFYL
ncbi:hypothetical protein [Lysinibacillus capsici]|nr:hypothetical protein [Lysinibacillus capsici]